MDKKFKRNIYRTVINKIILYICSLKPKNIMFELHYASLNLGVNDIPCFKFDSVMELNAYLLCETEKNKCVYLVTVQDEIYVTDNILLVIQFIGGFHKPLIGHSEKTKEMIEEILMPFNFEPNKIFIQEYPSFEIAYDVALMMHEENELCYDSN